MIKKEVIRGMLRYLPMYQRQRWRELHGDADKMLRKAVRRAVRDVPFYHDYDKYLSEPFDITRFPVIRKADIFEHSPEMVSRKAVKRLLKRKETGGSTGMSLELFYSPSTIIRKEAIRDIAFGLIGKKLKVAMLRGDRPADGKLWQRMANGDIMLSSYLLSAETLDEYLDIIRQNHITCLHVYPSSIAIMARLIVQRYGTALDLPDLKGILGSSEIFSREDKQVVMKAFPGVTIVDFYSHNELACAAIAVNDGFFKFYNGFGYVEFMSTGEKVNGNAVAEIVATSVMNRTMPFIRYATDDNVELDSEGNVVAIIGRTSDSVYTIAGEMIPCIVCTRDISFVNVVNFQFYQPRKGVLVMRIVPNEKFTDQDAQYILEDMNNSFVGRLECRVDVVNDVERTKAGKQRRLVQDVKAPEA